AAGAELDRCRIVQNQAIADLLVTRGAVVLPQRLRVPPGNRAHPLRGVRREEWGDAATRPAYDVGLLSHLSIGQIPLSSWPDSARQIPHPERNRARTERHDPRATAGE